MKSHDPSKYSVGQTLIYLVGKIKLPVTFLSYGPRVGRGVGKDAITTDPLTAIVRDENGSVMTVSLADLKPAAK